MHDFRCNDPDDMQYELIKQRARYLKENPEGVNMMCKAMEDLRDEALERGRIQGREQGKEIEKVSNIKKMMQNLKLSAQQAMTVLEIPEADQARYASLL